MKLNFDLKLLYSYVFLTILFWLFSSIIEIWRFPSGNNIENYLYFFEYLEKIFTIFFIVRFIGFFLLILNHIRRHNWRNELIVKHSISLTCLSVFGDIIIGFFIIFPILNLIVYIL